jgi:tetraacyldisaccharide 4'-kinase
MTELTIRGVWERKGLCARFLWLLLLPVSFAYRVAVQLRNFFFTRGWLKSIRLPCPVISIGNLTVGGTGKTPTSLWLAQQLTERGFKVAILSRGYQRKVTGPVILQADRSSKIKLDHEAELEQAGDEPVMMAQIYGQTLGIGKDRVAAADALLSRQAVDVFLLDDGFQHRRVRRNVDLLLLGQDTSGYMLPAGPFREPRSSLKRADFLLTTGGNGAWTSLIPGDRLANAFSGSLRPVSLVGFSSQGSREFPLTLLYRSKILTVTGIADPRGLYQLIHEWEGEIVETLEFPDHHHYSARDWQQISRMARLVDLIITTEKDILKLTRFPFAKDKLLALRVAMTVENGAALIEAIVGKIRAAQETV